jgi:hypothetical protein
VEADIARLDKAKSTLDGVADKGFVLGHYPGGDGKITAAVGNPNAAHTRGGEVAVENRADEFEVSVVSTEPPTDFELTRADSSLAAARPRRGV